MNLENTDRNENEEARSGRDCQTTDKTDSLVRKWNLAAFCENDKYAITSYCAVHDVDESMNLGDITKVDEKDIPDCDLVTWGFPCTDISLAGKQKGFVDEEGNQTRSGLYYEGIRILREKKPKISIIENVRNLTSKKFAKEFQTILDDLKEAGYNSYYQVLNAKDYGIPQNRERVFIVSIRKDIDNGRFRFPEPFELNLKLKDMLEEDVDDKYYLSDRQLSKIIDLSYKTLNKKGKEENKYEKPGKASIEEIEKLHEIKTNRDLDNGEYVSFTCRYDRGIRFPVDEHISPTICARGSISEDLSSNVMVLGYKENTKNGLPIKEKTKQGYKLAYEGDGIYINRPWQKRGVVQKDMIPTIKTSPDTRVVVKRKYELDVRKLTPREYWRLMAFDDDMFDRARESLNRTYYKGRDRSSSQLYKQAGNSIVVNCPYYIFRELYKAIPEVFDDLNVLSLFSGIGAFEVALDRLYENDINKKENDKTDE